MDYRKLAEEELQQVGQLRTAERICRERLAELTEQLNNVRIPGLQKDPVRGGGTKTEERWLTVIAAKMDEERRLKQLSRRLKQFDAAWAVLDDRDRAALDEWYIAGGNNCAERLARREHCEIRTAFRWRDEAIIRFARAFYGAVVD
jgi:hypothetical protein